MLHAQAKTPVLQSQLSQPKLMLSAASGADRTTTSGLRVSTGVVAPKLIHTVDIRSDGAQVYSVAGTDRKVVVDMVVDATGKPSALKIVKSAGPLMDENVLEAVSQYRYVPGTVSNQPTAVPVNLEIDIHTTR
jgi:TonB family protein